MSTDVATVYEDDNAYYILIKAMLRTEIQNMPRTIMEDL